MSKSTKTRKPAPKPRSAKGTTARKPTKTTRRTATSGQNKGQSRHHRQRAHQNARAVVRNGTKQAILIDLLNRSGGATLAELVEATGWQRHSVRGAISGTLKKKLGLAVTSQSTDDRGRVYRIE